MALRFLFTSMRNTGHFQPLVPLIEACRQRGHELAVAAPRELERSARATGATFFPVAHPGDAALQPIWARLSALPADESNRVVVSEIFAGLNAAAALPDVRAVVARFRPQLLVRESQEYASFLAAEEAQLPHVRVAIMLGSMEQACMRAAGPALDAKRPALGLPLDPQLTRLFQEPALSLFPASLDSDDCVQLHVSRFRAATRSARPLPGWWGERQGPLIYITLGTVAGGMDAARDIYRKALEAVAPLPVRALLTTGNELPLEALGALPSNAHVERFVPQADVLPHAAALLCHGGAGTVIGSLAAGVPMVVLPMFADQPQNAARLAHAGAGLALDPRTASAEALRSALLQVLGDGAYRAAAARLAAELAALPTLDEAVLLLERRAAL